MIILWEEMEKQDVIVTYSNYSSCDLYASNLCYIGAEHNYRNVYVVYVERKNNGHNKI
jgi:hypothetical protein